MVMTKIPTITAFEKSPDRGQGLARDMGVRWALEEVGQPYEVRLISFKELKEGHRSVHPFGKIPTFEQGDLTLFESGSIIFHIAETHVGLFPEDANARSRAITWIFAAFSTMEPPILEYSSAFLLEKDKPWYAERTPMLEKNIRVRLGELSTYLGDREWLDGQFSAGDLVMINVLRRLKRSGLLNEFPNVAAFVARGEERPAFRRAFAAQLAVFEASQGK
jgi:glutathione S-transferase